MWNITSCATLLLLIFDFHTGLAQHVHTPESYNSYNWDIDRLLSSDSSALNLHYSIKSTGKGLFNVLDPIVKFNYNSSYARGYNDGAVWKGRGFNGEMHFGISGQVGVLSYTLQPVAFFAQNRSFDLYETQENTNPYNYQFNTIFFIDWVQRYGDNTYTQFHLGQSEIKLAKYGLQIAVGTQNYVVGPANHFPIMLGNNAAGMPKLNIGTNGPQRVVLGKFRPGKLEFNMVYGRMYESEYFDAIDNNDKRFFNALFIGYQPSFAPTLTLGVNRVMYKQTRFKDSMDWFSLFYNPQEPTRVVDSVTIYSQNDFFDQMASVNLEWKFPSVGFRVYGEFAINDFNGKILRIMSEPDHSRAYILGFQKLFQKPKVDILFNYEHVNLSRGHTYLYRIEPTYYTHIFNTQGYTNSGQIMGAWIGPGGNADQLDLKFRIKHLGLLVGGFGRRTEQDKDYFMTNAPAHDKHKVFYDGGYYFYWERKLFILGFEGSYTQNLNRYYVPKENLQNLYFGVSMQAKFD